jgi:hypothetical protein
MGAKNTLYTRWDHICPIQVAVSVTALDMPRYQRAVLWRSWKQPATGQKVLLHLIGGCAPSSGMKRSDCAQTLMGELGLEPRNGY